MADREVLPESIEPSFYVLSLRNLNFENWTYKRIRPQELPEPFILNDFEL
ncbi:peptidase family M1 [Colletotrichum tabaci]|uniref:Peptidase family M1 n=1 Tax=Colletotrichum tabaci TaxID=1209068 RepID=A0AAV9TDZ8_9PEZI